MEAPQPLEGYLRKQVGSFLVTNWKRHWFCIRNDVLKYFERDGMADGTEIAGIPLSSITEIRRKRFQPHIEIYTALEQHVLDAEYDSNCSKWHNYLNAALAYSKVKKPQSQVPALSLNNVTPSIVADDEPSSSSSPIASSSSMGSQPESSAQSVSFPPSNSASIEANPLASRSQSTFQRAPSQSVFQPSTPLAADSIRRVAAAQASQEDSIKVGDRLSIVLGTENDGFLYVEGGVNEESVVSLTKSIDPVTRVPSNFDDCVFQISPMLRYTSQRALSKFRDEVGDNVSPSDAAELQDLQRAAEEEKQQNANEAAAKFGRDLLFGSVVQLLHVRTNKYLCRSELAAETDHSNTRLVLDSEGSKKAYFVLSPADSKLRSEGEIVRFNDSVCLMALKDDVGLSVANKAMPGSSGKSFEVSVGTNKTNWKLSCFESAEGSSHASEVIKAGTIVSLYFRSLEGFLSVPRAHEYDPSKSAAKSSSSSSSASSSVQAEQDDLSNWQSQLLYNGKSSSNIALHVPSKSSSSSATPSVISGQAHHPSVSGNCLFAIELENRNRGGAVRFNKNNRLRHLASGLYLTIEAAGEKQSKLTLSDANDESTIFTFRPLFSAAEDTIKFESRFRLCHEPSNNWIHVHETGIRPIHGLIGLDGGDEEEDTERFHVTGLSSEQGEKDIFEFRSVPQETLSDVYRLLELQPFLYLLHRSLFAAAKESSSISAAAASPASWMQDQDARIVLAAIRALTSMCTHAPLDLFDPQSDVLPSPHRQRLMREMDTLSCLLDCIRCICVREGQNLSTYFERISKSRPVLMQVWQAIFTLLTVASYKNVQPAVFVFRNFTWQIFLPILQNGRGDDETCIPGARFASELLQAGGRYLLSNFLTEKNSAMFTRMPAELGKTDNLAALIRSVVVCETDGRSVYKHQASVLKELKSLPTLNISLSLAAGGEVTLQDQPSAPEASRPAAVSLAAFCEKQNKHMRKDLKLSWVCELIQLYADLCLDRCKEAQEWLQTLLPLSACMAVVKDSRLPYRLRSATLRFILECYLDRQGFGPCRPIRLIRGFDEITHDYAHMEDGDFKWEQHADLVPLREGITELRSWCRKALLDVKTELEEEKESHHHHAAGGNHHHHHNQHAAAAAASPISAKRASMSASALHAAEEEKHTKKMHSARTDYFAMLCKTVMYVTEADLVHGKELEELETTILQSLDFRPSSAKHQQNSNALADLTAAGRAAGEALLSLGRGLGSVVGFGRSGNANANEDEDDDEDENKIVDMDSVDESRYEATESNLHIHQGIQDLCRALEIVFDLRMNNEATQLCYSYLNGLPESARHRITPASPSSPDRRGSLDIEHYDGHHVTAATNFAAADAKWKELEKIEDDPHALPRSVYESFATQMHDRLRSFFNSSSLIINDLVRYRTSEVSIAGLHLLLRLTRHDDEVAELAQKVHLVVDEHHWSVAKRFRTMCNEIRAWGQCSTFLEEECRVSTQYIEEMLKEIRQKGHKAFAQHVLLDLEIHEWCMDVLDHDVLEVSASVAESRSKMMFRMYELLSEAAEDEKKLATALFHHIGFFVSQLKMKWQNKEMPIARLLQCIIGKHASLCMEFDQKDVLTMMKSWTKKCRRIELDKNYPAFFRAFILGENEPISANQALVARLLDENVSAILAPLTAHTNQWLMSDPSLVSASAAAASSSAQDFGIHSTTTRPQYLAELVELLCVMSSHNDALARKSQGIISLSMATDLLVKAAASSSSSAAAGQRRHSASDLELLRVSLISFISTVHLNTHIFTSSSYSSSNENGSANELHSPLLWSRLLQSVCSDVSEYQTRRLMAQDSELLGSRLTKIFIPAVLKLFALVSSSATGSASLLDMMDNDEFSGCAEQLRKAVAECLQTISAQQGGILSANSKLTKRLTRLNEVLRRAFQAASSSSVIMDAVAKEDLEELDLDSSSTTSFSHSRGSNAESKRQKEVERFFAHFKEDMHKFLRHWQPPVDHHHGSGLLSINIQIPVPGSKSQDKNNSNTDESLHQDDLSSLNFAQLVFRHPFRSSLPFIFAILCSVPRVESEEDIDTRSEELFLDLTDMFTIALDEAEEDADGKPDDPSHKQGLQNLLCSGERSIVDACLHLIVSKHDKLVLAGLNLAIELLEGGNQSVQNAFLRALRSNHQVAENFFTDLQARLRRSIPEIKARQHHYRRFEEKLEELREAAKATGGAGAVVDDADELEELLENAKFEELGYVRQVMKLMQLLCENDNRAFKNLFNTQPGPKTVNLVSEALQYVVALEKKIDIHNVDIAVQAFHTLTEVLQGPCLANRATLCNPRLFSCINIVLTRYNNNNNKQKNNNKGGASNKNEDDSSSTSPQQRYFERHLLELKKAAIKTVLAFCEGQPDHTTVSAILRSLNCDVLLNMMQSSWVFVCLWEEFNHRPLRRPPPLSEQEEKSVEEMDRDELEVAAEEPMDESSSIALNMSPLSTTLENLAARQKQQGKLDNKNNHNNSAELSPALYTSNDPQQSLEIHRTAWNHLDLSFDICILLRTLLEDDTEGRLSHTHVRKLQAELENHDRAELGEEQQQHDRHSHSHSHGEATHHHKRSSTSSFSFASKTPHSKRSLLDDIGRVEILRSRVSLERAFFRKPDILRNLNQNALDDFIQDLDQNSAGDRVADLLDKTDVLYYEARLQERLSRSWIFGFLTRHNLALQNFSFLFAILLACMVIFGLTGTLADHPVPASYEWVDDDLKDAFWACCVAQLILQSAAIAFYWLEDGQVKVYAQWPEEERERLHFNHHGKSHHSNDDDHDGDANNNGASASKAKKAKHLSHDQLLKAEEQEGRLTQGGGLPTNFGSWPRWLWFMCHDPRILFELFLGLPSIILAIVVHPVFILILLLELIPRIAILRSVIQSIFKNGKSLLYTALLGFIIVILYGALAFLFLRDAFVQGDTQKELCTSLLTCIGMMSTYGFRGSGQWEGFGMSADTRPGRIVFDVTFFIVLPTLVLNMVFGIIVDTFSELRAERDQAESRLSGECIICSISRGEFERTHRGFKGHVHLEHNALDYVAFIVHTIQSDPEEFSGLELYVAECIKRKSTEFFPISRSIGLAAFTKANAVPVSSS